MFYLSLKFVQSTLKKEKRQKSQVAMALIFAVATTDILKAAKLRRKDTGSELGRKVNENARCFVLRLKLGRVKSPLTQV